MAKTLITEDKIAKARAAGYTTDQITAQMKTSADAGVNFGVSKLATENLMPGVVQPQQAAVVGGALSKYKTIEESIANRKANAQMVAETAGTAQPIATPPVNAPTTTETTPSATTTPASTPTATVEPVKTETSKTETVAPIVPPPGFEYGTMMDTNTGAPVLVSTAEVKRQKDLANNRSLYTTGKGLYDAVQSGAIFPGSQAFGDLQLANPQVFTDYNAVKTEADNKKTIESVGNVVMGNAIVNKPDDRLDIIMNSITKSFDEDISTTYKNVVNNDPAYLAANEKVAKYNQEMADVTNNLNKIGDDTRKMYDSRTPESLIASAIAREAKPLILQAQYIQDQLANAQAEATNIMENNRALFDVQMQDRTDKRNMAWKLYDTINAEEIRQEDIQREDERIEKQIALEEFRYQRGIADGNTADAQARKDKLDDLKLQQEYNLQTGLLDLGIDPTGMTPEEMKKQYAGAIKSQPTASTQDWDIQDGYKINTRTGEIQPLDGDEMTNTMSVVPDSFSGRTNATQNIKVLKGDSEIMIDLATGTKAGQCAFFANDYGKKLPGYQHSGNEWASKQVNINSKKAVAGGLFMYTPGAAEKGYGHIGIVEKVNSDGSIQVYDSNYSGDQKTQRRTIQPGSKEYKLLTEGSTANGGFFVPQGTQSNQSQIYDKLPNTTKTRIDKYVLDFENEQIVKDYNTMAVNVEAVRDLEPSNTNDQQMIYTFAKVMDPNSVVRESEYATVQEYSQALTGRFAGKISRLYSTEGFLTDDAKNKMFNTLYNKVLNQKKAYDNVRNQTKKQIKQKVPGMTDDEIDSLLKEYTFGSDQMKTNTQDTSNMSDDELWASFN